MSAADDNAYREPIQSLDAFVKIFQQNPHLELEGRLGKYDVGRKAFVSGVSEEYFGRIQKLLASSNCWSQCLPQQQSVDFFFANNLRHSSHGKVSGNITVQKTVVATLTLTCEERDWDIRFRLCEEKPMPDVPINDAYQKVRLKRRDSFITIPREVSYDLTIVQSGTDKEQACKNTNTRTWEVEVELLRTKVSTPMAANLFVKMVQLLGVYDRDGNHKHLTFKSVENTMSEHKMRQFGVML